MFVWWEGSDYSSCCSLSPIHHRISSRLTLAHSLKWSPVLVTQKAQRLMLKHQKWQSNGQQPRRASEMMRAAVCGVRMVKWVGKEKTKGKRRGQSPDCKCNFVFGSFPSSCNFPLFLFFSPSPAQLPQVNKKGLMREESKMIIITSEDEVALPSPLNGLSRQRRTHLSLSLSLSPLFYPHRLASLSWPPLIHSLSLSLTPSFTSPLPVADKRAG